MTDSSSRDPAVRQQTQPAWPTHYPPDDEISLFDLWDALVRRRWVVVGVTAAVTVLAVVYALAQPDVYRYRQVLEIGSRVIEGDVQLIESPSSAAAKLNESYIPAAIHSWAADNPDARWQPGVDASVPQDADVVVLSADGTAGREQALTRIIEQASGRLITNHQRIVETLREEIEAQLTSLRNDLEGIEDKRERLRARLERVDEQEALVKDEIDDLESLLSEAEASRREATRGLDGAAEAMTLLMLSNEARQARQRLADLRTRLRVELANTRDQLTGSIAEQQRRLESKRSRINAVQTRLDNLSRTQALAAPQQSLRPVGASGRVIATLGLVLGAMLGVFAAFFAEFVAAARRRHEESEASTERGAPE